MLKYAHFHCQIFDFQIVQELLEASGEINKTARMEEHILPPTTALLFKPEHQLQHFQFSFPS